MEVKKVSNRPLLNHLFREVRVWKVLEPRPLWKNGCQFHQHFTSSLFWTKVFFTALLYLKFGFVIFWHWILVLKAACKMLVKLTTGWRRWRRRQVLLLQEHDGQAGPEEFITGKGKQQKLFVKYLNKGLIRHAILYRQFHQHFTTSFCINILLRKNYKAKRSLEKTFAKHFCTKSR